MARERIRGLGTEFADMFSWPRKRDKQQKPEFPLDPAEITRLEDKNKQILEKEDFGRKDFGDFCKNMVALSRKENYSKDWAELIDQDNGRDIQFSPQSITVRAFFWEPDVEGGIENYYQWVSYRPQKFEHKVFREDVGTDYQPVLETTITMRVPKSIIEYPSYFSGKKESAFPEGEHVVSRRDKLSDKEVQAFCRKVYRVYASNKEAVASSSQQ